MKLRFVFDSFLSIGFNLTFVQAIHAMDEKNIYEAYELYLSAQLWNSAHDLAVLELAPDAILRRDIPLLQELFEPFDLEGRRDKVEGWYVRGKVRSQPPRLHMFHKY